MIPVKVKKNYCNYVLLYFSYFFGMAMFLSILSIYLSGSGKSDGEVSLIVSASGLFSMALQPCFGFLYDRVQKERTISMLLLSLSGLFGVLFALTKSTFLLFLLNGTAMSLLNAVSPVCERLATGTGYPYGLIRIWGAVGYAAGAQVSGLVYENVSPQGSFFLFGAAMVLTIIAFAITTDNAAPKQAKEQADPKSREGIFSIFTLLLENRSYLLFAFISFLFSGCASANSTYLTLLLGDIFGSTGRIGTVLFAGTMMEIPIILFSGKFMDRLSGKTLLHIDFSLLLIQFTTYSFLPYAVPVCLILFLCRSTATMLYIMVTIKVVLNLVDRRGSTTALAVVSTMKSLGGVIVTMIAGAVSNAYGRPAVFTLLLGIAATGFILSALLKIPGNEQQLF